MDINEIIDELQALLRTFKDSPVHRQMIIETVMISMVKENERIEGGKSGSLLEN